MAELIFNRRKLMQGAAITGLLPATQHFGFNDAIADIGVRMLKVVSPPRKAVDPARILIDGLASSVTLSTTGVLVYLADLEGRRPEQTLAISLDGEAAAAGLRKFVDLIRTCPPGIVIAAAFKGDWSSRLDDRAYQAIRSIGSSRVMELRNNEAYALIGRKGAPPGLAIETVSPTSSAIAESDMPVKRAKSFAPAAKVNLVEIFSPEVTSSDPCSLRVDGVEAIADTSKPGVTLVLIKDGTKESATFFDTGANASEVQKLVDALSRTPDDRVVAIATKGAAFRYVDTALKTSLAAFGSTLIGQTDQKSSWTFVGGKTLPRGCVTESIGQSASSKSVFASSTNSVDELARLYTIKASIINNARQFVIDNFGLSGLGSNLQPSTTGISAGAIALSSGDFDFKTFEPEAGGQNPWASLYKWVIGLPVGRPVVLSCRWQNTFKGAGADILYRSCELLGSQVVRDLEEGDNWVLIGAKGIAQGSAVESSGSGSICSSALLVDRPIPTQIFIRSSQNPAQARVKVSPDPSLIDLRQPISSGLNVLVVDPETGTPTLYDRFDQFRSRDEAENARSFCAAKPEDAKCGNFDAFFDGLKDDALVAIATNGNPMVANEDTVRYFSDNYRVNLRGLRSNSNWSFIGPKKNNVYGVTSVISDRADTSLLAWMIPGANKASSIDIIVGADGKDAGNRCVVLLKGGRVAAVKSSKFNIIVLDETSGLVLSAKAFDLKGKPTDSDAVVAALNAVPSGRIVLFAADAGAMVNLKPDAVRACETCGSARIHDQNAAAAWVMIGFKGQAPGASIELYSLAGPVAVTTRLPAVPPRASRYWPLFAALIAVVALTVVNIIIEMVLVPDRVYRPPPGSIFNPTYDQWTYLAAHNAATWQQSASIKRLLDSGVRALALDTHLYNGDIMLCHEECRFQIPGLSLKSAMTDIVSWMDSHPNDVVTLFIEDKLTGGVTAANNTLYFDLFSAVGAYRLIYWPDGSPTQTGLSAASLGVIAPNIANVSRDGWPQLRNMANGRRLLVFVDRQWNDGAPLAVKHIFPFVWQYMRETEYGDQNLDTEFFNMWTPTCQERRQSANQAAAFPRRRLLLMNHFPTLTGLTNFTPFVATRVNSYNRLLARAQDCARHMAMIPNFIELDLSTWGDGLRVVNKINRMAWSAGGDQRADLLALPQLEYAEFNQDL